MQTATVLAFRPPYQTPEQIFTRALSLLLRGAATPRHAACTAGLALVSARLSPTHVTQTVIASGNRTISTAISTIASMAATAATLADRPLDHATATQFLDNSKAVLTTLEHALTDAEMIIDAYAA